MSRIRSLDAYPKINEDFYSRTLSGGVITLASSVVMLLLFFSELNVPNISMDDLDVDVFEWEPSQANEATQTQPIASSSKKASAKGSRKGNLRLIDEDEKEWEDIDNDGGNEDNEAIDYNGLYLHAVTETKLVVDTSRGETLRINFDITFPALPCSIVSVDAMDISGEQHLDVRHDIIKKRLDSHGNVIETRQDGIGAPKIEKPLQRHGGRLEHNETYCGSCYGAEASDDDCCNSCEDVREAYRKKGWAISNPDLIDQCAVDATYSKWDVSIFYQGIHLAFDGYLAPSAQLENKIRDWEWQYKALEKEKSQSQKENLKTSSGETWTRASLAIVTMESGISVSTINCWHALARRVASPIATSDVVVVSCAVVDETDVNGHTIQTNQFSVTEHFRGGEVGPGVQAIPGVFFFYDLSPIKGLGCLEDQTCRSQLESEMSQMDEKKDPRQTALAEK
nr:endoplasmic reticulum-Golgi intermediate compartment protein 3-like isoform X1 [Ipomoea batatas]